MGSLADLPLDIEGEYHRCSVVDCPAPARPYEMRGVSTGIMITKYLCDSHEWMYEGFNCGKKADG